MTPLDELAAAWPTLDRLLDEALALPVDERTAWLAALPAEHAALKDTLARLLAAGGDRTGGFLATLPRLDGLAAAPGGPDPGAPRPGDEVGPYRLVQELGEGGMGSVWLAQRADGQLKRPVALKLPRLGWARGLAERMARERDILATLEHPHIARLYDAGIDALGRPWLALEYVPGLPIDQHARAKELRVQERVALLLQVCEAVAYAHRRLVIHRDLKPGNILVTDEGHVMLLDFGIARLMQATEGPEATALTALGGRALTLDYASPEQVRGEPLTTASDVYGLGVVAYELLAGARPYRLERGSAAELEEAIERAEVPPPSAVAADAATRRALAGDLDAIVLQALRKDPAHRYPTVQALADDLARHLAGEPIVARPERWPLRLLRRARRHPLPLALAGALALAWLGGAHAQAAVMLALAAGLLLALWQRRTALREAARARAEAAEARRQRERAELVKGFALGLFEHADVERGGTVHTSALELLQRAEADLAAAPDGDAETGVELRVALARALLGLDQAEAALRVVAQAEALAGARLDPAHPQRLQLVLVQADALQHRDRHAEALPLLEALLPGLEAQPATAAAALRRRAQSHFVLGHYPEALADVRAAVQRAEAAGDRLERLLALNEQTRMIGYQSLDGRLASAEQGLEAARRCDPRRHALPIAEAREAFAMAHCLVGDAQRGLDEYRAVVADLEARLGTRHSRLASTYNSYAAAQIQCGAGAEAIAAARRSVAIDEDVHGPQSRPARFSRMALGLLLANEGRFDEGLALLRQALADVAADEGAEHPMAVVYLNRFVGALTKAGELDEAGQRLAQLRAVCERAAGGLAEWRFERARWLRACGDCEQALAELEPLQADRLAAPAPLTRGAFWELLGGVQLDAGRPAEAVVSLAQALALYTARAPRGSVGIARVRQDLGRARLALGEPAAAVQELRAALAYWDAHGPALAPGAEAAAWLALALQAAGEAGEAADLAARAARGPWRQAIATVARLRETLTGSGLVQA